MKLSHQCPYCDRVVEIISEQQSMGLYLYKYDCGHSEFRKKLEFKDTTYSNLDGTKEAYQFQIDGINFAARTNFRCIIADEMGLGKTIQSLLAVRNAKLFPCVVLVRASTIYQWIKEIQNWASNHPLSVYPVTGTAIPPIAGFDFYVVSMDTLSRNNTYEKLAKLKPKSVIIDECHSFKDESSKRTTSLIKFFTTAGDIPRLLLSGTPIKNRANEFFTPLNLIAPDVFKSKIRFERDWLIQDDKGQYTRLKPWRIDAFHELLSKFSIRREKKDVLTNLPSLKRNYTFVTTYDPDIKELYNSELDLFENFMQNGDKIGPTGILGWLAKLRGITAMGKIPFVSEYIANYLESSTEKICVGIHHHSMRDALKAVFNCLTLSGEDSALQKDQIVEKFRDENQLLVANIASGGLGLNLQFCANALVVERYWNSADEEQFEGRFHRNGQTQAVTIDYMMLSGTIDEWFHDLVTKKKEIFNETVNNWNIESDSDSLKDLAWQTINNRL